MWWLQDLGEGSVGRAPTGNEGAQGPEQLGIQEDVHKEEQEDEHEGMDRAGGRDEERAQEASARQAAAALGAAGPG